MLRALGEEQVLLLSNKTDKSTLLDRLGVTVIARVPSQIHLRPNGPYLAAEASRCASRSTSALK